MTTSNIPPHLYLRKVENPYHQKLADFSEFVLRDLEGKVHKGLWRQYLQVDQSSPLALEIGVGYGDFLFKHLNLFKEFAYIGIDIRFKRSFGVAKKLKSLLDQPSLENAPKVALLRAQAETIEELFAENEIDRLYCFCPDPWPKTKHHKNRLLKKSYLELLSTRASQGALFYFKTDNEAYYEWFLLQIEAQSSLKGHWKIIFQTSHLYDQSALETIDEDTKKLLTPLLCHQTRFEELFMSQKVTMKALILKNSPASMALC